jgi:hypothetical protein
MNKMIKKIIYLIILAVALTGFAGQTKAEVLPTVQFEQTPLFSNVNFAPGDSVSRWVKLNNNTTASHRVVLRTINAVSTGDLKEVVGLVIKQGETILYDNTFANLFSLSELILPQVAAGEQATFDFIATFKTTSGNEYQKSTIGFNLQIGFEDTEEVTDDTVVISGGSHGSGSIIIGSKNLIISQETINNTEPAQPDMAVVSWNTNLPSTSQVIYGLASEGPYILNLSLPYFGYPLGTTEDVTKVLSHSVVLYDLIPEQIYNFRVVSKASPPTISYEHTFMLKEDGTIIINPVLAQVTPDNQNNFLPGEIVNNQNGDEAPSAEQTFGATTTDNENGLPLSAAIGSIGGFSFSWWWVVVIIVLGGVLYYIYKKEV